MKLDSIVLGLIFMAMGVVQGTSVLYDANLGKMVLNTTTFSAPHHHNGRSFGSRAADAAPNCSLRYGLARINETAANIGHLSDVANVTCSVPAATCARVSHEGRSSIFFYNFESQDINTTCGSLIQPAKQVLDACATGYSYASGYVFRRMVDGSQSVPYLVVIGDDYVFAPNRGRSELDGEAYRDLEVLN